MKIEYRKVLPNAWWWDTWLGPYTGKIIQVRKLITGEIQFRFDGGIYNDCRSWMENLSRPVNPPKQ